MQEPEQIEAPEGYSGEIEHDGSLVITPDDTLENADWVKKSDDRIATLEKEPEPKPDA